MPTIEEITARLNAATPGPWDFDLNHTIARYEQGEWEESIVQMPWKIQPQDERNAEFIIHAPSDIAALLELVREWQEIARRLADGKIELSALNQEGWNEWSESFEIIGICGKCMGKGQMPCECVFDSTPHNTDRCDRCSGSGKAMSHD